MSTQNTDCDDRRIEAFFSNSFSEAELSDFQSHLETCEECVAKLASEVAEPSFWGDAKEFLSSSADINSPAMAQQTSSHTWTEGQGESDLQRMGLLDPTDDPRMMGRFGGYEISGIVGRGGMGMVLKGWDVSLNRYVAIKILSPDFAWQSAARTRFAREAQAAAAVVHDNIISIYGVDEWNDMPYLVMPYVKGESLQHRIDRKAPLSVEDILQISLQIARGLAAAHDQGLVHRDVKPANILMPQSVSRIIITDFGLARSADDASLTRSGVLAGTPQYMSPEQATGDAVDFRTDIFSLGSVMYAMACGRPPFRAENSYGVLRKITDTPHRSLIEIRPDVPPWLSDIVDRCLEKNVDHRFQSASQLAGQLEDSLAHLRQPTTTLLPSIEIPSRNLQRRKRWAIALIACAVLLGFYFVASGPDTPDDSGVPTSEVADADGSNETNTRSRFADEDLPRDTFEEESGKPWSFDDALLREVESDLTQLQIDLDISPSVRP